MKWVDGGKAIFKVSTSVVSTVYTQVALEYSLTLTRHVMCKESLHRI